MPDLSASPLEAETSEPDSAPRRGLTTEEARVLEAVQEKGSPPGGTMRSLFKDLCGRQLLAGRPGTALWPFLGQYELTLEGVIALNTWREQHRGATQATRVKKSAGNSPHSIHGPGAPRIFIFVCTALLLLIWQGWPVLVGLALLAVIISLQPKRPFGPASSTPPATPPTRAVPVPAPLPPNSSPSSPKSTPSPFLRKPLRHGRVTGCGNCPTGRGKPWRCWAPFPPAPARTPRRRAR